MNQPERKLLTAASEQVERTVEQTERTVKLKRIWVNPSEYGKFPERFRASLYKHFPRGILFETADGVVTRLEDQAPPLATPFH